MRRKIIRCLFLGLMLAVFVLVFTDSTVWTQENVIITRPINSKAFQKLVDSVAPHTTIKCIGGSYECYKGKPEKHKTFPIRITKPLRIVAADENNPPIFIGTFDPDYTPWKGGNNCFMVYNLISNIKGLEFVGLHFQGFRRALAFSPSYDPDNPPVPVWAGVLSGLRIVRCQFSDCFEGILVYDGQIKNFEISDNFFIDALFHGIVVFGGVDTSFEPPVNIGRPKKGTITGNTIQSARFGIDVSGSEMVTIHDNIVDSWGVGIWFCGDYYGIPLPDDSPIRIGSVSRNNVQANDGFGIICYGLTTMHKSLVQNNFVSNSFVGITLEMGANNFNIVDNEFVSSVWSDIWLGGENDDLTGPPDSHDNTVIATATDFVTTVTDYGINNTLVGNYILYSW
ncbi:hypothetical protein ES703_113012 [subsurface metagenome]